MSSKISPYLSVLVINFKQEIVYRAQMVLSLILRFSSSLVLIIVWATVYYFSGTSTIHGLSLSVMTAYFFMTAALIEINTDPEIIDQFQNSVENGSIISFMIRPISFAIQLFLGVLPRDLIFLCFGTIPILILILTLSHMIVSPLTMVIFAGQIAVAYIIVNLIGFMIGSLSMYLTNIYGVANAMMWISQIANGSFVPLMFYPKTITAILMLTPFPITCYVPIATIIGLISTAAAIQALAIGFVWVLILFVLAKFTWIKVNKVINAVGV